MAQPLGSSSDKSSWLPWWVVGIIVLGVLIIATGGILALVHPATLVGTNAPIDGAASVYAGYLVSRNLGLALMLAVMLGLRARRVLAGLLLLTLLTQIIDLIIDSTTGRVALVPPIVLLTVAFAVALVRVADGPLWHAATWRG